MGAVVPKRKRIPTRISSKDNSLAEHFFGLQLASFQSVAMEREVPKVSQKQGVFPFNRIV
jgi:hypothetical protein